MKSYSFLALFLVACTSPKLASTIPSTTEPEPTTTEPAPEPIDTDGDARTAPAPEGKLPPAPTDPESKPTERPAPQPEIRTCSVKGSSLRSTAYFTAKTFKLRLGNAVIQNKVISELWATGTPSGTPIDTAPVVTTREDGEDLGPFLGARPFAQTSVLNAEGRSALDSYLEVTKPTVTQMTHSIATFARTDRYVLEPVQRTSATPDDPGTFVSALQGTRAFGLTLMFRTSSACANGALADALQKGPTVTDILAPKNRDTMQALLQRDGTSVAIVAYTTRRSEAVAKLVLESGCSVEDLGACQAMLDAAENLARAKVDAPTYTSLTANTDPAWAVMDYDTDSTTELP